jgi:hypothetical protein
LGQDESGKSLVLENHKELVRAPFKGILHASALWNFITLDVLRSLTTSWSKSHSSLRQARLGKHGEFQSTRDYEPWLTRYSRPAIMMGLFVAFGGVLFGYDTGTIGGIIAMDYWKKTFSTEPDHYTITAAQDSLIVSILSAVSKSSKC